MSARLAATLVVGAALVAAVACSKKEAACTVDLDCGQGSFCRSGLCAVVAAADGGAEAGSTAVCVGAGASCTTDGDCCSPPCNSSGRCAGAGTSGTSGRSSSGTSGTGGTSGTSGSTSSGGNCQDLYALCSFDGECCQGLSCDPNGTCR